jgi:serine/threonine protein kinase
MLPFNDRSMTGILANTISGRYGYSEKRPVSPLAKNLIDNLLKNKPLDRISLEEAVKHPWFHILKEPRPQ